ncbi:MAG TPA: hypothetical protein VEZ46_04965 [Mycobacteriales bacterium]|jgi:hypothetical protein|nr:hypothetical protein [Mycobacteriales bacterium]
MADDDLFDDLSRRLRDAHLRVRSIDADDETKGAVVRRLIAITNASKHDLARASQRLDSLVADLDAGRYAVQDE